MLIGGGNVVLCPYTGPCQHATPKNLFFPNGLKRGSDGLVYILSALKDEIQVMELDKLGKLSLVEIIKLGMPVDNFAVDAKGDIWAAGLPKVFEIIAMMKDPFGNTAPSTIFQDNKRERWIRKR